MRHERDLFANFDRMRREMDELFGDVLDPRLRGGRGMLSRGGFTPAVDVYYVDDPPRAVVKVDLSGVDPADVELEIRGRELLVAGTRRPETADGRAYQQVEIERGPFRRVIALGAAVDADAAVARYEHGQLVVELPLERITPAARQVPIEGA